MEAQTTRGSEKLLNAWKARTLTDGAIQEIAGALDKSPARVESATVVGGSNATGVQLSLRYQGDDVPWCGNDIQFWLKWHLQYGGRPRPPRIIINGIPYPEYLQVVLDFGDVTAIKQEIRDVTAELGQSIRA